MFCTRCDSYFEPRGRWQRTCTACWVADKRRAEQELQDEVLFLRDEVNRLRRDHRQQSTKAPGHGGLDDQFIRKLLMLTHPDRHGNSTLSNTVTAQLLAMRNR